MAQTGSNKKVANSLVALSSAAVLAVYAAGYTRTKSAAQRFEVQTEERRPAPARTLPPVEEVRPAVPVTAEPIPSKPKQEAVVKPRPAEPAEPVVKVEAVAPAAVETPAPPVLEPAAPPTEPKAEIAAAPPAPAPPPPPTWKDGTYLGWGTSRHGDIQASVVIRDGRIESATIAQCWTRYSCSVISKLPPEVAERQSPEVDYVSGATQSANAFYYAVVEALGKAK